MRWYSKRGRGDEMVSASEIAAFVFCPEAWRLEYGLGLEPGNAATLEEGDRHHTRNAGADRAAGGFIAVGRCLIVLAVLVLVVLWVMAR